MKTFEEKWTAWLDGQLSGKELAEFEASLADLEAAEAEKGDALRLGAFLKEQLAAQPLSNEEFFSHQLHERIAHEREDLTQILNSRVDPAANPNATIYIFESKNDNKVTVLWTEGLQSLPADYAAK